MKKRFTRNHLAQHCPTFLRVIDKWGTDEEWTVQFGSREEKIMLFFLGQNGFTEEMLRDGYSLHVDDFGGVVIEVPEEVYSLSSFRCSDGLHFLTTPYMVYL